jgi:beta-lactamase family protein
MDETIARYAILVSPPGEVFQYSNLGYGIIDHIIARVSRRDYADFMRTEVFQPLGLTRTSVHIGRGLEDHVAQRYDSKQQRIPFYDFDHDGGSAMYASAHDLVRFGMWHLKNRLGDQTRILADSTIDRMQRPATPDTANAYGLGWGLTADDNGYRRVAHTGGMPGVATVLNLYPTANLAVVVLTNRSTGGAFRIAQEISASVLRGYADTLRARRGRDEGRQVPSFTTPADLAGEWTGTIRTWQDTVPFTLVFQPDGDVHATLGTQLTALINGPTWRDEVFSGRFAGTIPTPDASRQRHSVLLNLRLKEGKLFGQASAQTTQEPVYFALTSYVQLTRKATTAN